MKKTRCDSWEQKLDDETKTRLFVTCGSLSYNAAKVQASETLQVKLPCQSTWYRFLERMRKEDSALRLAKANSVAKEMGQIAQVQFKDAEIVKSLQSLGAEAALSGNLDDAMRLMGMAVNLAKTMSKAEELDLARNKFEAAERRLNAAAKTVTDETLTDEQRVGKIKELFGIR